MEAYLPPRYYEPHDGLLIIALAMSFVMFVLIASYKVAAYGITAKSSPGTSYRLFLFVSRD
jgi:hypothetical protein